MKQYKLINRKTGEETICTKVVVDGFDYYVSGTPNKYYEGYYIIDNILQHTSKVMLQTGCKVVIATNNPSIDIGQVIDECHISTIKSLTDFENKKPENYALNGSNFYEGFKSGYNTHSSTHSLSDEEVVGLIDWISNNPFIWKFPNKLNDTRTSKELLQLFKEQQIKTIWYE